LSSHEVTDKNTQNLHVLWGRNQADHMDASRNFTISEGRYHKGPCYLWYKVEQQGTGQREGCALGFKTFFQGGKVLGLEIRCHAYWTDALPCEQFC
jgi:hypothetical protein